MADTREQVQGMLTEYNALRAEILGTQRDAVQILGFAATVSTALFAYGISIKSWWPFAFLELLLWACVALQAQRGRAAFRIGSYISVFLEGKETGLMWQTRWARYQTVKGPRHERVLSFRLAVSLPILCLQIVSLGMLWAFWGAHVLWACVISLVILAAVFWEWHMVHYTPEIASEPKARFEAILSEERGVDDATVQ